MSEDSITTGAITEAAVESVVAEAVSVDDASPAGATMRSLETLSNVELAVTVELGRTRLLMKDLLGLRPGSVVELDRHVGAPVDVFVNSTLLAHGEVVVVDEELGVRITAIAGGSEDEARGA